MIFFTMTVLQMQMQKKKKKKKKDLQLSARGRLQSLTLALPGEFFNFLFYGSFSIVLYS